MSMHLRSWCRVVCATLSVTVVPAAVAQSIDPLPPSSRGGSAVVSSAPRQPAVAGETVGWGSGVSYEYDASGNVYAVGSDHFAFDAVGRLVGATVNGVNQDYEYDRYGNRTRCTQDRGTSVEGDCQYGYTINAASNRFQNVLYDAAGNVQVFAGHIYTFDSLNALVSDQAGGGTTEHVYDATGERVASYTAATGRWRWTFRDASGRVLREFTSADGPDGQGLNDWRWTKDYIWRDAVLFATRQVDSTSATATTYHYHTDHLGTPRRITDDSDRIVAIHDYAPYGRELVGGINEPSLTRLKFTGHERDSVVSESWDTLDYQHARYYSATFGRFFSVDPANLRRPGAPQAWNRYAYARQNPVSRVDLDGRKERPFTVIHVPVNIIYNDAEKVINSRGQTLRQVTEQGIVFARNFMAHAGIALDVRRYEASIATETIVRVSGFVSRGNDQVPLREFTSTTRGANVVVSGQFANDGTTPQFSSGTADYSRVGVNSSEDSLNDEIAHQLGNFALGSNTIADVLLDWNEERVDNGGAIWLLEGVLRQGAANIGCNTPSKRCGEEDRNAQ